MNVLKAIKVAELRKKLSVIPAKIIFAVILTFFSFWDRSFEITFKNIPQDPKKYLLMLVFTYGIVSYVYFFIRLMHNWFIGLLLSVGVAALVINFAGKMGDIPYLVAMVIMIFGGPIWDIINLIRYHSLKNEVIRAEEERIERSYGEGYDEGFRSGMREGRMDERNRLYEDYEDDYRRSRLREGYEDDYRRSRLGEDYEDDYRRSRPGEDYEDDYEERLYERRRGMRERDEYDRRYVDEGYGDEEYLGEDDGYYEDDYYEDDRDARYDEGYDNGYNSGYDNRSAYSRVEDDYEEQPRITKGDSENAAGFFADCKTPGEIKRRYHDLCKVYHPDSGNGSAEIFYRIKNEYDRLKPQS